MKRKAMMLLALALALGAAGAWTTGYDATAREKPRRSQADVQAARVELGRRLFFDHTVSRTGSVSCASCHDPEHGFSDPRRLSEDESGPSRRHSQSVLDLPRKARQLARNRRDGNQAFAFGERAWGVQFHPEFDADILRGYLRERREEIAGEGLDPDAIHLSVGDSDHGRALLRRFAALAGF